MPGIQLHCPSCKAALRGTAALAPGASIRCNKCNAVFRYKEKAASQSPSSPEPDAEDRRPVRDKKGIETTVRRPVAEPRPERRRPRDDEEERPERRRPRDDGETRPERRSARDDEAEEEAPVRRGKPKKKDKRSNVGLLLGLSIGGGAGLLVVVVVVIGVGAWLSSLSPPAINPVIAHPAAPTVAWAPAPPPPPADGPAAAPLGQDPLQVVDAGPIVNPAPIVNPRPVVNPIPATPAPAGNGTLAEEVLDKVKKATVYIRVTGADGVASGSGFFDGATGMVLTNAHVIGMLHADEPPPQKLDVVLQSGEKDEKTLPGRIVAVDRVSDLAVLAVDVRAAGLAAPPAALTLASASALRETQQVFVFGFPFGEGLGKNITVSTSSISSLRKDKDGMLAQVQVNGGMNPGNSGGPVVDTAGNVVGVAVAGIRGTQINFAIPGDLVQAVFRGRCSDIRVGEAFRKGDQIAVPVDMMAIDPLHALHNVALDWWVGDPKDVVGPATTQPAAPAPPLRQTAPLTYQPDAMKGHADLILASLPPPGKVVWVQPTFVDGSGQSVWVSGLPVQISQPLDAKPAVLALRPQVGKARLNLKSTATVLLRTGDGEKHSLYNNIDTRMIEDTRALDARGVASVYDSFEHFEVGQSIDGKGPQRSARWQAIVQDVGKLGLNLTMDPQGDIIQKQSDLQQVPPTSRDALDGMGDQLLQSLDVAAVPIPGGMMQPGQSWQATRNVPIDTLDTYQTAAAAVRYTFRGVRSINGHDFGIVAFDGVVRPPKGKASNLTGQIRGTAAIDLAAGRVYQVHAAVDMTLDVRFRDESLRCNGALEVNLTRTNP